VSALPIGSIVFACVFGSALLGLFIGGALPEHHLSQDSKDVVKLGMGLIATTSALVLGLLIASAKTSFDTQNDEVKQAAANIVLLDRALAHYGPETKGARDLIRRAIAFRLATTWPEDGSRTARLDTPETTPTVESVEDGIRGLSPSNDAQRGLQSRALQIVGDLQRTRWLLFGGASNSMPTPFVMLLVFWISLICASFGLIAPRNATVVVVLFVCALSIATSIFLVVELGRPFEGIMKISSGPMRYAFAHLDQ